MADYSALRAVLDDAFNQSAKGKGSERHANGKDFQRQPILEISRMVGPGFATGQAMKKAQEATTMAARGDYDAATAELLGSIVYAAAAVIVIKETADSNAKRGGLVSSMRLGGEGASFTEASVRLRDRTTRPSINDVASAAVSRAVVPDTLS